MPEAPPAIHVADITLTRGRRTLLAGVSWRVPRGACCAVLGPNGAGKSTLLSIVMGYMWPQHGEVRVLGEPYGQVDLTALRRRMGLLGGSRMPQCHEDRSALENVLAGLWGGFIVPLHERIDAEVERAARRELEIVGLADRAETAFGTLSTGERVRVQLARALVGTPDLLIMDEPTAGLDMAARAAFVEALDDLMRARPALSVALVTHHVEDLPAATREVLLLADGRVMASGPVEDVLTSANLSEAFAADVELHRVDGRYWTHVRPRRHWDLDPQRG